MEGSIELSAVGVEIYPSEINVPRPEGQYSGAQAGVHDSAGLAAALLHQVTREMREQRAKRFQRLGSGTRTVRDASGLHAWPGVRAGRVRPCDGLPAARLAAQHGRTPDHQSSAFSYLRRST